MEVRGKRIAAAASSCLPAVAPFRGMTAESNGNGGSIAIDCGEGDSLCLSGIAIKFAGSVRVKRCPQYLRCGGSASTDWGRGGSQVASASNPPRPLEEPPPASAAITASTAEGASDPLVVSGAAGSVKIALKTAKSIIEKAARWADAPPDPIIEGGTNIFADLWVAAGRPAEDELDQMLDDRSAEWRTGVPAEYREITAPFFASPTNEHVWREMCQNVPFIGIHIHRNASLLFKLDGRHERHIRAAFEGKSRRDVARCALVNFYDLARLTHVFDPQV